MDSCIFFMNAATSVESLLMSLASSSLGIVTSFSKGKWISFLASTLKTRWAASASQKTLNSAAPLEARPTPSMFPPRKYTAPISCSKVWSLIMATAMLVRGPMQMMRRSSLYLVNRKLMGNYL